MSRTCTQVRRPNRERMLVPVRRLCPACGTSMRICYENRRTLVTPGGRRLPKLQYGAAIHSGVRGHAVAAQGRRRKGFGFAGAWTVVDQNRLLELCFGLSEVNKV